MELSEWGGDVINMSPGLGNTELTLDSVAEVRTACNFIFSSLYAFMECRLINQMWTSREKHLHAILYHHTVFNSENHYYVQVQLGW
jgi:hypothetical protein